jgi:hypothetical protein
MRADWVLAAQLNCPTTITAKPILVIGGVSATLSSIHSSFSVCAACSYVSYLAPLMVPMAFLAVSAPG